jgi:hypothetical protein
VTADLLWAPSLRQQLRDQLLQDGVGLDTSTMMASPARGRVTMGIERAIPAAGDRVAA